MFDSNENEKLIDEFKKKYLVHDRALLVFAKKSVISLELAEDLVSETILTTWQKFRFEHSKLKGPTELPESPIAWMKAILRNRIRDFYRKNNIIVSEINYYETLPENKFRTRYFDTVEIPMLALQEFIQKLGTDDVKLLLMMEQECDEKDIANEFGLTVSAVYKRQKSLIKKIQQQFRVEK